MCCVCLPALCNVYTLKQLFVDLLLASMYCYSCTVLPVVLAISPTGATKRVKSTKADVPTLPHATVYSNVACSTTEVNR